MAKPTARDVDDSHLANQVQQLLDVYRPKQPRPTADALRKLWLQMQPRAVGIKAQLRDAQEAVGAPIPQLRVMGAVLAKASRKRVDDFLPLAQLLWNDYGREGRVLALLLFGALELQAPQHIVPLLQQLCRDCITWEDADRLAMDALEPIVRKNPEEWLPPLAAWLTDDNKWVRRSAATVLGRLPMKSAKYTERCLEMIEPLIVDQDIDVKKAVSFAIRIAARGEVAPVREMLARNVPPKDPLATWVLCDALRSMTKTTLPQLTSLLPKYQRWAKSPSLSAKDKRSIDSAIQILSAHKD